MAVSVNDMVNDRVNNELSDDTAILVKGLAMHYDGHVIQENINFVVERNEIFVIMGNSGSGKSSLMRTMTGLSEPAQGDVWYRCKGGFQGFWQSTDNLRLSMMEQFGVMFQNGALFSSMTLLENVSLRLTQVTKYSAKRIRQIASLKLALVGLKGFEHYYPAEISGGMQKRVGIARAMAMDPPILFFDEPSAGLDPDSSKLLDDLLLELRNSMGITMVVVTHDLDSIFSIANNAIFLDHDQKTIIAHGNPQHMLQESHESQVQAFLRRGKTHES